MNNTQLQDRETYLFWANHYKRAGQTKEAKLYQRLADENLNLKGQKMLKAQLPKQNFIPIYDDPDQSTGMQGLAELVTPLEVYPQGETQTDYHLELWEVLFAGQNESVHRVIKIAHSQAKAPKFAGTPRVKKTAEEKKAARKARQAARRAKRNEGKAPKVVLSAEEKLAKKKAAKAKRLAGLKALLALTPKKIKKAPKPTEFSAQHIIDTFERLILVENPKATPDFAEAYRVALENSEARMQPAISLRQLKLAKKAFRQEFKSGNGHE